MSTQIIVSGRHRQVFDDANPRVFRDEYRCAECGEWVDQENVVWVDPATGEATTGEFGKPYHDGCAPEEEEEAEVMP